MRSCVGVGCVLRDEPQRTVTEARKRAVEPLCVLAVVLGVFGLLRGALRSVVPKRTTKQNGRKVGGRVCVIRRPATDKKAER